MVDLAARRKAPAPDRSVTMHKREIEMHIRHVLNLVDEFNQERNIIKRIFLARHIHSLAKVVMQHSPEARRLLGEYGRAE